ncbi:MAG: hypothetical protein A2W31_12520 [Planctomycetes bacterium RBG_16_64_10]|nr:MAG: hypothetical protein A2W31_12520 [Planctomycetes bacterium RBG_16_64_10]
MRIIDRYLIRQFVQIFTVCFVSLIGLYIVIDAFGHMDELIRQARQQEGNLLAVVAEFYAYRSLDFFDRTSSILGLIAAMFTVTWVQRHNELTALLAAGIPKFRVMTPILASGLCVSLMAAANRELVIPRVRHELGRDAQDLTGQEGRGVEAQRDMKTGILIDGERLQVDARRVARPTFHLPYALSSFGNRLEANEAHYQDAAGGRPAGYLLQGVTRPSDLASRPSLLLAQRTVIITPQDADWLADDACFVVSDVGVEMLEAGMAWRQYAATWELIRGLRSGSVDFGADVRVAVHTRFVQPLVDATLLFLGLPLVLWRDNRNVFVAIGLCLMVVVLFMLVLIACQYLGASSLIRPPLAAWLPLLIFVPVAVRGARPLVQ